MRGAYSWIINDNLLFKYKFREGDRQPFFMPAHMYVKSPQFPNYNFTHPYFKRFSSLYVFNAQSFVISCLTTYHKYIYHQTKVL